MTGAPIPTDTTLTGIAAILQAIVWPSVVLVFFLIYRVKLRSIFDVVVEKLRNAKHLKVGQIEIDMEQAIGQIVKKTGEQANNKNIQKNIPEEQIQAAQAVGEKLNAAPIAFSQKLDVAHKQVYKLIDQYETVRRELPSGSTRTRTMNEITAKMRALAIVAYPLLPLLMAGEKPGERLAAICVLQVKPELVYFEWLIERVMNEDQPFLFFHASLAILELVKSHPYLQPEIARNSILGALQRIASFQGGQPDQNTIDVLEEALSKLERTKVGSREY